MKKPKTPQPKWTVTSKTRDNGPHDKTIISHLKYEGRKVHVLTGRSGEAVLQAAADTYNAVDYSPLLNSTTLLHELSAAKRRELDDLCAKSVPDLFPVESEVKA